jgi:hypothetical protein
MNRIFSVLFIFLTGLLTNSVIAQTTMCNLAYGTASQWDASINQASVCPSGFEAEVLNNYGLRNFSGSRCEANSQKGRMMNALWVLRHAHSSTYDASKVGSNSGILLWAYRWAGEQTDILETTCADHTHFQKVSSGFPYYRSTYYMRFNGDWLFNGNLIERAGVIVHEARHRQVSHVSDSACPRGGSCDTFNSNGANFYEWSWLNWFAVDSDRKFTDDMRERAMDAANRIATTAFAEGWFSAGVWANTSARPIRLQKQSLDARGTELPAMYIAPTIDPYEINNVSEEYCWRTYGSRVERWSDNKCYLKRP